MVKAAAETEDMPEDWDFSPPYPCKTCELASEECKTLSPTDEGCELLKKWKKEVTK